MTGLRGLLSQDELSTQRAVNRQLMLKKEEVEWQLMGALAKVGASQPAGRLLPGTGPTCCVLPAPCHALLA
jgi:hypothetical protein